jgi:uncharacterized membrane protein
MRKLISHVMVRPRLLLSMLLGAAVALLLPVVWPHPPSAVTRSLLGWNVAVWSYLLLAGWMMWHADHHRLRRIAVAQAESAGVVLVIVVLATVVSLVGNVVELMAAKVPGTPYALSHVLFAFATGMGAWLLVPTTFAMTYASLYYRIEHGSGLEFPHIDDGFKPDYADFLYFALTIAVAAQTADVSVTARAIRRLVLLQSVLTFAFNTAILAFTINVAASMF